jgi:serine/threonine protein kinase
MSQTSTSLDAVLSDLEQIVKAIIEQESGGNASYDAVQKSLPELSLHILTYIRFLENEGYVVYDRVADIIRATAEARAASDDANVWRDQAASAFADHISESSDGGLGDLTYDVDGILDDIDLGLDGGDGDDDEYDDSDMGTAVFEPPDEHTHAEPPAGANAPDSDTSPEQETMNQNDSFASRRLSSTSASSLGSSNQRASAGAGSAGLYERTEEIGTGGIGTVFKGRQVKLDRDVAIKEIREIFDVFAGVQRSDIVERFTEIVQAQASLGHPNIIQVVDIDTAAEFPYVVMQYAPNGNLRRLIETDDRPPLQVALKYFLQVLHALNTAHDADIYHGGIKPENVVLDVAGNALLTDFGISAVADLDTNKANQVFVGVGTVAYMSPEQFRDPNSSSVKSDIYSLGIMLYEMLTGKVPGRRSPMPSSFFPDIPRKLDDIFDRMSMDDPADRYNSIDDILADVYGSKEIMKILDKRGGFVFLRDPLVHGAVGLSAGAGGADSEVDEDFDAFGDEGLDAGSIAKEIEAEVEHSGDDDDDDDVEVDGDVLDKLNKYSEMFDEEDEDSDADDSEADDSEADDSEAEDSEAEDSEAEDSDASEAEDDGDDD